MTMKPFMLVMVAVMMADVRPETGLLMLTIGVVYIEMSYLNNFNNTFAFEPERVGLNC